MLRLIQGDKRAMGGPVEDLTALLVVSIGAAILLASLANAFLGFGDTDTAPEELLDDIIAALRTYKKLTTDNTGQGIYSSTKLGAMNATLISLDLNIGCDLCLEFREKSGYGEKACFSTRTSDLPDVGLEAVLSRTTPVGISYAGTVHAAVMTVTIWGYA